MGVEESLHARQRKGHGGFEKWPASISRRSAGPAQSATWSLPLAIYPKRPHGSAIITKRTGSEENKRHAFGRLFAGGHSLLFTVPPSSRTVPFFNWSCMRGPPVFRYLLHLRLQPNGGCETGSLTTSRSSLSSTREPLPASSSCHLPPRLSSLPSVRRRFLPCGNSILHPSSSAWVPTFVPCTERESFW